MVATAEAPAGQQVRDFRQARGGFLANISISRQLPRRRLKAANCGQSERILQQLLLLSFRRRFFAWLGKTKPNQTRLD